MGFNCILMDLSKAYDSPPRDLLILKLDGYGLSHKSLKLILDYLRDRTHRVKIGSTTRFSQLTSSRKP